MAPVSVADPAFGADFGGGEIRRTSNGIVISNQARLFSPIVTAIRQGGARLTAHRQIDALQAGIANVEPARYSDLDRIRSGDSTSDQLRFSRKTA